MSDRKAILTKIRALSTRGKKFAEAMHECAVECLTHADGDSGDWSLATKLHEVAPPSYQPRLRLWFTTFGPAVWSGKKFLKSKSDNANVFDLTTAGDMSPDELASQSKPEPAQVAFDAEKQTELLKKYVLKAAKVAADAGNTELDELFETLAAAFDAA